MRSNTEVIVPLAVVVMILALPSSAVFSATPSVWFVAPTPAGTGTPGGSCSHPGFNTISAAITAASPGDIINVCPGTYTEQVTISESLTIQSTAGSSHTTIQAPATMTPDSFGELNIVTITGAATTATLSGFTIAGPLDVTCNIGTLGTGIFVEQGATATITKNVITKIHDSPIVQCAAYGIGILVGRAALSTTGTATIAANIISDYQKSAIEVDNAGSLATITGNTITGWSLALQAADSVQIAQNGIQISRGAVATITSNAISMNECPNTGAGSICGPNLVTQTQATGMLLYMSGAGTSVTKNTLLANDIGVFLEQADPTTIVASNTIINNRYAGMVLADGTYTASSNTLKGLGTSNVGIAAIAFSVNTSVTLSKNTISGFTVASIGAYATSGLTATILSS